MVQAKACHTCPEVSGAKFVVYTERLNLLELCEDSLHDWVYEKVPHNSDLEFELTLASMQATEFEKEQAARTELARAQVKQQLLKQTGYTWWTTKLRPQCLKCRARHEGITEDEAKRNLVGSRNVRTVPRASSWLKAPTARI